MNFKETTIYFIEKKYFIKYSPWTQGQKKQKKEMREIP